MLVRRLLPLVGAMMTCPGPPWGRRVSPVAAPRRGDDDSLWRSAVPLYLLVAAPRRGDDDVDGHECREPAVRVAAPRRGDDDHPALEGGHGVQRLLPLVGAMMTALPVRVHQGRRLVAAPRRGDDDPPPTPTSPASSSGCCPS